MAPRITFQTEGEFWQACFVLPDNSAHLLGSIRAETIETNLDRRKTFIELMEQVAADLIETRTGTRPTIRID